MKLIPTVLSNGDISDYCPQCPELFGEKI